MCVFFSPRETEITISAGSGGNGRKSCWSCGIEKETKKKKKKKKAVLHRPLKQWLKHQKDNSRLKILLHLLPLRTLKDRDRLTVAFRFRLHKWNEVRRGVAGVATNSIWSFLALFHGTTSLLTLNSKCGHLKLKSFIHWSDCETRRWFEVLTVTSQTAFSDYRAARQWLLSIR